MFERFLHLLPVVFMGGRWGILERLVVDTPASLAERLVMSKKVIGSYFKWAEVHENSAEWLAILANINVDHYEFPNGADDNLMDAIRAHHRQVCDTAANEYRGYTDDGLEQALSAHDLRWNRRQILEQVSRERWSHETEGYSYDRMVEGHDSCGLHHKRCWFDSRITELRDQIREEVRSKKTGAIMKMVEKVRQHEPHKAAVLQKVIDVRRSKAQQRQQTQAASAAERAAIDAMSIPDLLDINPRYWNVSKAAMRYRLKRIREHAISEWEIGQLIGIDWWGGVAKWLEREGIQGHRLGRTRIFTDDGYSKEVFHDRVILKQIEQTFAYLTTQAIENNEPLPADQERRLLAHGIANPDDPFVQQYVNYIEQRKRQGN